MIPEHKQNISAFTLLTDNKIIELNKHRQYVRSTSVDEELIRFLVHSIILSSTSFFSILPSTFQLAYKQINQWIALVVVWTECSQRVVLCYLQHHNIILKQVKITS
jgi:hypothetical protein